jgi:hypothetical protein
MLHHRPGTHVNAISGNAPDIVAPGLKARIKTVGKPLAGWEWYSIKPAEVVKTQPWHTRHKNRGLFKSKYTRYGNRYGTS